MDAERADSQTVVISLTARNKRIIYNTSVFAFVLSTVILSISLVIHIVYSSNFPYLWYHAVMFLSNILLFLIHVINSLVVIVKMDLIQPSERQRDRLDGDGEDSGEQIQLQQMYSGDSPSQPVYSQVTYVKPSILVRSRSESSVMHPESSRRTSRGVEASAFDLRHDPNVQEPPFNTVDQNSAAYVTVVPECSHSLRDCSRTTDASRQGLYDSERQVAAVIPESLDHVYENLTFPRKEVTANKVNLDDPQTSKCKKINVSEALKSNKDVSELNSGELFTVRKSPLRNSSFQMSMAQKYIFERITEEKRASSSSNSSKSSNFVYRGFGSSRQSQNQETHSASSNNLFNFRLMPYEENASDLYGSQRPCNQPVAWTPIASMLSNSRSPQISPSRQMICKSDRVAPVSSTSPMISSSASSSRTKPSSNTRHLSYEEAVSDLYGYQRSCTQPIASTSRSALTSDSASSLNLHRPSPRRKIVYQSSTVKPISSNSPVISSSASTSRTEQSSNSRHMLYEKAVSDSYAYQRSCTQPIASTSRSALTSDSASSFNLPRSPPRRQIICQSSTVTPISLNSPAISTSASTSRIESISNSRPVPYEEAASDLYAYQRFCPQPIASISRSASTSDSASSLNLPRPSPRRQVICQSSTVTPISSNSPVISSSESTSRSEFSSYSRLEEAASNLYSYQRPCTQPIASTSSSASTFESSLTLAQASLNEQISHQSSTETPISSNASIISSSKSTSVLSPRSYARYISYEEAQILSKQSIASASKSDSASSSNLYQTSPSRQINQVSKMTPDSSNSPKTSNSNLYQSSPSRQIGQDSKMTPISSNSPKTTSSASCSNPYQASSRQYKSSDAIKVTTFSSNFQGTSTAFKKPQPQKMVCTSPKKVMPRDTASTTNDSDYFDV